MSAVYPASIRDEETVAGSRTELPQVVIHGEVREAHPFRLGHLAKMGMRLLPEVSRLARKAIHEAP